MIAKIVCLGCEAELALADVDVHAPVEPHPADLPQGASVIPGGHSVADHAYGCPGGGPVCDRDCPVQTPCGPLIVVPLDWPHPNPDAPPLGGDDHGDAPEWGAEEEF